MIEDLSVGDHVVQSHGQDQELPDGVTEYLLSALQNGDAAIVIAAPARRREFEARLERAGIDAAQAQASGAYQAFDAAETVGKFVAEDWLNYAAFNRAVGERIRQAGAGGRTVRVYSEMVALLWDHGLVDAAAQLEVMWDELAHRDASSLFSGYRADSVFWFCGYRTDSAPRDRHLNAFAKVRRVRRVRRVHRERAVSLSPAAGERGVLGAVRTFVHTPYAPAATRHFAVAAVSQWEAENLADDVALVVTELAANAVQHAQSGFTAILSAHRDVLRIAIRDASPLPPEGVASIKAEPMYGLGLVQAVASRWGVEPLGSSGKIVWAELNRLL